MNTIISLDLSKNQGLVLDLAKTSPMNRCRVELSWGAPLFGATADIDLAAMLRHEKAGGGAGVRSGQDVIFYKNMSKPGIELLADVREQGSTEVIVVEFAKTEQSVIEISLWGVVFRGTPEKAAHTFQNITNGVIRLFNDETNELIQEFALGQYTGDTLGIGTFKHVNGEWVFEVNGNSDELGATAIQIIANNSI